jgi:Flp pilus assembly protein TadD
MPALRTATAIAAAALLSGCLTAPAPTKTEVALIDEAAKSVLPASAEDRAAADRLDLLSQAKFWGEEYEKNPNEYEAALKYAHVLRSIGSSARAAEVAGQALNLKQGDVELTLAFAQASLDQGKAEEAATALARAEKAGENDWRMLSIIGVTMDSLDQHKPAQDYYKRALALSPDNPKILSNLGLSYALEGKPGLAEETLRRALASPEADARVKLNLMLVLGVQGKFDEAEKIAGPDTPKALVESNKDYFRTLLSPSRSWEQLRGSQN